MTATVCAVVATFNRKDLLGPCLRSLKAQTRPLDGLVVVDNASSDDTLGMLADEFPELDTLALDENLGGAGGFHHGMAWAYRRGFHWMWLVDDDVEVTPDALEELLRHSDRSDFLQPRRFTEDGPLDWEGVLDFHRLDVRLLPQDSFAQGKSWTTVRYACFEGALIHRRIVDRIGLPDVRFFVGGDDQVYGLRASFHTNILYIAHAGVKRVLVQRPRFTKLGCYLTVRNKVLRHEHFSACGLGVSRWEFALHYTAIVLKYMGEILLDSDRGAWDSLRGVLLGVRDGLRGRYGRPPWLPARPTDHKSTTDMGER